MTIYTLMRHTHFISNLDFSPELQTSIQTAIRHLTWLPDSHLKFNFFKTNSWLSCLTLFLPYLSSSSQLIAPCAHAKNLGISIDSFFPSLPKFNSNKLKYPNSDTSYHLHLFHPSPSHHLLSLELCNSLLTDTCPYNPFSLQNSKLSFKCNLDLITLF